MPQISEWSCADPILLEATLRTQKPAETEAPVAMPSGDCTAGADTHHRTPGASAQPALGEETKPADLDIRDGEPGSEVPLQTAKCFA